MDDRVARVEYHDLSEAQSDAASRSRKVTRVGWMNRLSVGQKLNFAVFGNTMVLGLILVVMLGRIWTLYDTVQQQWFLVSIEVRSNNAALLLGDAADLIETAEAAAAGPVRDRAVADAAAVLDVASDALTVAIEFGGGQLPATGGPEIKEFRSKIDNLRNALRRAASSSDSLSPILEYTLTLHNNLGRFALNFSRLSSKEWRQDICRSLQFRHHIYCCDDLRYRDFDIGSAADRR